MITVRDLSVKIGSNHILSDVSLTVSPGMILAVIGANGAGKTTLLRTISGSLPPTQGSIEFNQQPTLGKSAHALAREGLIHVPQGRQIIPGLSVRENLEIGANNIGASRSQIETALTDQWHRFPILEQRQTVLGTSLSGGEQQMLAVARGLMMQPKVLMLDEPSLGLAPQIVRLIMKTLRELAERGLAIVLVEQVAMLALEYADQAIVLRNGQVVMSGDSKQLLSSADLVSSYLA